MRINLELTDQYDKRDEEAENVSFKTYKRRIICMLSSSGAVVDEDMLATKTAIAIGRRRVKVLAMN